MVGAFADIKAGLIAQDWRKPKHLAHSSAAECGLRGATVRLAICAMLFACGVVSPAFAEVITIRCPEVTGTTYEIVGDAIAGSLPRSIDFAGLQLNLATGEFTAGDASGVFVERDGAYVAMAHNEPYYGVWEINRTTGRLFAVGHTVGADGRWIFARYEGQCLGPNMVVPF